MDMWPVNGAGIIVLYSFFDVLSHEFSAWFLCRILKSKSAISSICVISNKKKFLNWYSSLFSLTMIPFLYGAKVPKQTAPNLSHFSSCCKRLHATSQTTSVPNLFTHFSCCFSNFPFRRFIVFNIILLDGPSKFFWNIVLDVQIVNRLYSLRYCTSLETSSHI